MSAPVPSFGEARKAVSGIIAAEDPCECARALADGSDDPSTLKIAEYALLVPVIKRGVAHYLENNTAFDSDGYSDPPALQDNIGTELGARTVEVFEEHPHREAITELARHRSKLVSYKATIFPVENTLRAASQFSSSAMFGVAVASALTISREMPHWQRPRAQFIDAVKNSHQPAIARSVMHFLWNDAVTVAFFDQAGGLMMQTHKPNEGAIAYDSSHDRAVVAKPLNEWVKPAPTTLLSRLARLFRRSSLTIGDIPTADSRVGCPFSFEPELLKGLYEHVVDTMEYKNCWPSAVLSMRQLGILSMQSKTEVTN
jgi:hypothetical protein